MTRAEWQRAMGLKVEEQVQEQEPEAFQGRQQQEIPTSELSSPLLTEAAEGSPRPETPQPPARAIPSRQYRPIREYRPLGGRPFDEGSYRATQPWKLEGCSRATWFRRNRNSRVRDDADHEDQRVLPVLFPARSDRYRP